MTEQTFKTEGEIKAKIVQINRRGAKVFDWEIEDEFSTCDSCLICNHYKYNHNNIKKLNGTFVHICLVMAPKFIDVTSEMLKGLNTSCIEHFSRRAVL